MASKLRNEEWTASYRAMADKYGTLSPNVQQAAQITGTTARNVCSLFPDGWSGLGRGKTINLGLLLDQYFLSVRGG